MKIVIAGGTGFIGEPLVQRLVARGDDVAVLSRDPAKVRMGRGIGWDATSVVANADAVVNLAGESIADGRWTEERKRRLVSSRIDSTRKLVEALRANPSKPRTFVSASAIGIYGDRGDATLDENAPRGSGFLADLVEQWEAAAREAEALARVVLVRFGVVLDKDGGALAKMLPAFRLGAGGPIGSGKQWMSWVTRDDAIRLLMWAIDEPKARGVYNAVAPEAARSRDFARALGRALHRPALFPVPAIALRTLFGREMADEALLAGQHVLPSRALAAGFTFEQPSLDAAFRDIFSARK